MPFDKAFKATFSSSTAEATSPFGNGFKNRQNLAETLAFRKWYDSQSLVGVIGSAADAR